MSQQPHLSRADARRVDPDPVENIVEIFLGAAVALFVQLCLLLPPDGVLLGARIVLFAAGFGLAWATRTRWWGVGLMVGVLIPVLYVQAFIVR